MSPLRSATYQFFEHEIRTMIRYIPTKRSLVSKINITTYKQKYSLHKFLLLHQTMAALQLIPEHLIPKQLIPIRYPKENRE